MNQNTLVLKAEPNQLDFTLERTFDAPKELVFKAFSETELFKKWWGGAGGESVIDKHEPRSGGSWRFIERAKNEKGEEEEYAFHGVYHTFSLEEGIIQTFEWEGMPGHVLLESMRFEDKDGKTTIKSVSVFQSQEDRDGMIASGMESGAGSAYDKLEALLQEMQQG